MEKIPTAEEFIKEAQSNPSKGWTARKIMIEFAKLHVEAALKAKIEAMKEHHEDGGYSLSEMDAFTRNSYPLINIK
jgi:hypothetical protein